MKARLKYIDGLKGFAIFCVLWGHSIQYMRNDDFFHNAFFEFIYAFHMPLFFFISGYFFSSSLKLTFKEFFTKKITQLLLPCVVWAFLFYLIRLVFSLVNENSFLWQKELIHLLNPYQWPFWFLKELFFSYAITFCSLKILKKEWLAFLICIGIILSVPWVTTYQRFLLPVFLAGIMVNKQQNYMFSKLNTVLLITGILFFSGLFFWKGDYTIYVTGFPKLFSFSKLVFNFQNIDISMFRLFLGLSGSLFFFFLFKKTYTECFFYSVFEIMGKYTLAIYILQVTILENTISRLVDFSSTNIWIYNIFITPGISIITAIICVIIINLARKNKKIEYILFGSSYKKQD